MKLTQIFLLVALTVFVLIAFTPQESQGGRRALMKLKGAGLLLLLLKKNKKIIFPFPIPLPLPIPILKERVPVAEVQKVAIAEPEPIIISEPASYGSSYSSYGGMESYGGYDGY